ncbi:zinc ABC transporter substrate-binding protein [candidate division LCP-89 bacterium B3_LCP]|uniref:Zinc ABC transporter substrate-binding protein n=1 Tax=candidate division LCP-89 bacterium B3_LCP TaxID=2012998 RepID=A0A532UZL0_UNCL8|nr:MAG: zinc ABC transporter substrate-binding protein [candidate division LCP-89 bacterium B3_LCP]
MTARSTITLLLSLFVFLTGCQKTKNQATSDKLHVVCSFLPVYVIAKNIVKDVPDVELTLLLPPEAGCPHNYALTPPDALSLEKADILILNGLGMEQFLEDTPFTKRPDLHIINATQKITDLIEEDCDHPAHQDHERHLNPHGWVSPAVNVRMVQWIGSRLGEIDPENGNLYAKNSENYIAKLGTLMDDFKVALADLGEIRIVTYHNAFAYFARDLNLEIVTVIEPDPGTEPSAREVVELIAQIKAAKPIAIFSEPQYSNRLVKLLSEETGVPHFELDPASSGDSDPESFIRVMKENLETLKEAIEIASSH